MAAKKSQPFKPVPAWQQNFLAMGIGFSMLLHAFVLAVHFRMPDFKFARPEGLEVVLVNARHQKAPEKADKLAQANLDGGGNSDAKVTPKTPLPPQAVKKEGDALVEARRRVQQLEAERKAMLTRRTQGPKAPPPQSAPDAESDAPPSVSGMDLMDSSAAIARLEAQIDKRLEEYAKRPRRTALGAKVKEYRFAQYVEAWRQKIERIGTLNFPDEARGKIYGSLLVSVSIRADGSLEKVEVLRSSGHKVLDEAALRIVRLGAPYAAFPPDIRKDTDILEIVRTWTFTNSEQVVSSGG